MNAHVSRASHSTLRALAMELKRSLRTPTAIDPWAACFRRMHAIANTRDTRSREAAGFFLVRAGEFDLAHSLAARLCADEPSERAEDLYLHTLPRSTPHADVAHADVAHADVDKDVALLWRLGRRSVERLVDSLAHSFVEGHHRLLGTLRRSRQWHILPAQARAELHALEFLWLGDYDAAHRLAVDHIDSSVAIRWINEMASALYAPEADSPEKLLQLRSSVPIPGVESITLRAWGEAIVRLGRRDDYDRVGRQSPHHPVVSLLETMMERRGNRWIDHYSSRALRRQLLPLLPSTVTHPDPRDDSPEALWQWIALFGGNRSNRLTVAVDGALVDVPLSSPRRAAEDVQLRILVEPLDKVLEQFSLLAREYPEIPFYRTYAYETLLWFGRYEEARAAFDEMWKSAPTRWAYVGLGAALALQGEHDAALRVWEQGGQEGGGLLLTEATYCYRGEIHLHRRELDAAIRDLEIAVQACENRLRALLLLGIARDRSGQSAKALETWRRAVRIALPIAMSASEKVGVDVDDVVRFVIEGHAPSQMREWVTTMLNSLHGNASSVLYTWSDGEHWHATRPHDSLSLTAALLGQASSTIDKPNSRFARQR